ncbi:putative E3 ubiquitin-protein ligase TRIML2 [Glossophaga mutica]
MFKLHSLELPQNISEDDYCQEHKELLLLFCEDDQVTMCGRCCLSKEHNTHRVCGIKEAAENYRNLFWEVLSTMKEKLEVTKILLAEEQEKMVIIQIEMEEIHGQRVVFNLKSIVSVSVLKGEEQDFQAVIQSEYKMIFRLMTEESDTNLEGPTFNLNLRKATPSQQQAFIVELEDKFQETLQRLSDLGKENMRKLQESELRLYEQIFILQLTIIELERKCGETPMALLKDAQDCFERLIGLVASSNTFTLELLTVKGMLAAVSRHPRCTLVVGPVTLDPTTAHSYLLLSEDLRTVRFRNVQQSGPGNPERFDYSASVLGVESFTSGRHYWEVDVENATKWQLGVYEDTASGPDIMLKPSGDKYLLMASMVEAEYTFWVFPPLKRVSSGDHIHKVGIFLDYKYGQIAFYNVTKGILIYSFSCLVFDGALKPIFSLCFPNGVTDTDSLTICLPEANSYNSTVDPQPFKL